MNSFSLAKSKVKLMSSSDVVRFVFPIQGAGFFLSFALSGGIYKNHSLWLDKLAKHKTYVNCGFIEVLWSSSVSHVRHTSHMRNRSSFFKLLSHLSLVLINRNAGVLKCFKIKLSNVMSKNSK